MRKRASVTILPRSRWRSRPSETSCLRRVSRSVPSTTSSADFVEAKKSSRRRAADPERAGDAAGEVDPSRDPLVDPGGRHRAAQLLERGAVGSRQLHQREDRLGVDRHLGLRPLDAVLGEDLLVVDDDPVVDPDHRAVPDRMIIGEDGGVALGVVAHVHEHVRRVSGQLDRVEERRGA